MLDSQKLKKLKKINKCLEWEKKNKGNYFFNVWFTMKNIK